MPPEYGFNRSSNGTLNNSMDLCLSDNRLQILLRRLDGHDIEFFHQEVEYIRGNEGRPAWSEANVPYDEVFDELDALNKILFFSRLRSKVVPYIIKVLTEIFPELPDSNSIEISFHKKRSVYQSNQARLRFKKERLLKNDR